jgi:hypothetical protein
MTTYCQNTENRQGCGEDEGEGDGDVSAEDNEEKAKIGEDAQLIYQCMSALQRLMTDD